MTIARLAAVILFCSLFSARRARNFIRYLHMQTHRQKTTVIVRWARSNVISISKPTFYPRDTMRNLAQSLLLEDGE